MLEHECRRTGKRIVYVTSRMPVVIPSLASARLLYGLAKIVG